MIGIKELEHKIMSITFNATDKQVDFMNRLDIRLGDMGMDFIIYSFNSKEVLWCDRDNGTFYKTFKNVIKELVEFGLKDYAEELKNLIQDKKKEN